jgi:hypothetical protein
MHGALKNASARPLRASPQPSKSGHHYGCADLVWDGLALRPGTKRGRVLATVEPDSKCPGMYRVHHDGKVTDMVNLSRAKDAAISIALSKLNTAKEAA